MNKQKLKGCKKSSNQKSEKIKLSIMHLQWK